MTKPKENIKAAVVTALNMLNEVYAGRFVITAGIVGLWNTMLEGFSPAIISAAVLHLIATRTQQWPPTIAEVRAAAFNLQAGCVCEVSATEAWIQVQPYVQGQQTDVSNLPPLTQQVLQFCGGVDRLGHSTNYEHDRRAFVQAYEALQVVARTDRWTLPAVKSVAEQHRLCAPDKPPGKLEVP